MDPFDVGTRLEDQNPTLYLGVGVLSLAKAGLLVRLGRSAGRELRDAGLFLGAGLALRSYQRRRRAREGSGETEASESVGTAGATDGADETGTAGESADERERPPAAAEPVVVTATDEADGTDEGSDRRRSPLDAVADAVERLSASRT